MCGRYNIIPSSEAFLEVFGIIEGMETFSGRPRYNIAPSGDTVPAVRRGKRGRALCALRWPLIPHWAKEGKAKFATANAKGETARDKASFRDAWKNGLPDPGERLLRIAKRRGAQAALSRPDAGRRAPSAACGTAAAPPPAR